MLLSIIISIIAFLVFFAIFDYYFGASAPIPGIFQIPGSLPFIGNLHQVLDNPALVYLNWAKKYNVSLFQIRLGNKRIVVANSCEDVIGLWVNHSCQNNSRPLYYTFHGIVSATQGFTVGSTPASLTYQRKKKAIGQYLNKKSVDGHSQILDNEIKYMIRYLVNQNKFIQLFALVFNKFFFGRKLNLIMLYFQLFALRSSIFLAYGIHLDCYGKDRELCQEIIDVENKIIRLRSPISNLEDSIPILRYIPFFLGNSKLAKDCGDRRNKYINHFHQQLVQGISEGNEDSLKSIVGRMIQTTTTTSSTQQNQSKSLTESEIQSICLTLFIPSGTHLFMNAYAANHDAEYFVHPYQFRPERWIDPNTKMIKKSNGFHQHFAFGAGSRMCAGYNLAFKEIYMITLRLILLFEIHQPCEEKWLMGLDPFGQNSNPRATAFEPKVHKVRLNLRELPNCEVLYEKIFND
ncbi:uncharacterized protein J8A68_001372 [[Candida] subhashii]|uniref:Cytochrome P450 n=1 Tax=[Candida] subhashii TaxID=561895 RepID=A0A8J5QRF8_9ASCO|nr:uncharacterized protein J8A68_001372 [[Candida] subhashii]KAG7665063.1 hypothetical protein J8A68_001372 [[Candida] subhashii]